MSGPVPAAIKDLPEIQALLRANRLPADDIGTALIHDFLLIRHGRELAGAIGLEHKGTAGLLRSLVVREQDRGRGWGRQLVAALETHARHRGVRRLYLLTTGAADFFAALGYREIPRQAAPAGIMDTAQFKSLCPASARLMEKSL